MRLAAARPMARYLPLPEISWAARRMGIGRARPDTRMESIGMNDANHIHSTSLAWVRDLVPDNGKLTPAQAMRRFGPPDLVAEMDRQVETETAGCSRRPHPPCQPARRRGTGRLPS